jgi:hypothetical protein
MLEVQCPTFKPKVTILEFVEKAAVAGFGAAYGGPINIERFRQGSEAFASEWR